MAEQVKNGYLRWWQFWIGILILFAGVVSGYTKAEAKIETNTMRFNEYKQESKDTIAEIKEEVKDINEIKLNLKVMMEHFDLKYIEK